MKNKKTYILYILSYLAFILISIIICFLLKADVIIYVIATFIISLMFLIYLAFITYNIINNKDPLDFDKIVSIPLKFNINCLTNKLIKNGFEKLSNELLFQKEVRLTKQKFKRYIFISTSNNFDITLEEGLLLLQEDDRINKQEYFEMYVVLFTEIFEYQTELYKECNANYFKFPKVNFSIEDKLLKCIIYNKSTETLHYLLNEASNIDLVNFIENSFIKE